MENLSENAKSVIEKYLKLPLGEGCAAPYFNNARKRIRGGLRALVGKGSPDEIAEEARMFAIKDRISLEKMPSVMLTKFLVDHNIGIDCSGLAYHILGAEVKARKNKKMSFVVAPYSGMKRKIRHFFRPAENTGVSTFSHKQNSFEMGAAEAKPGDFISIFEYDKTRNHMMIVEKVARNEKETKIEYVHAVAYSEDGVYNHGVRRGEIIIKNGEKIIDGDWKERNLLSAAKKAKEINLRRLNIFKY